MNYSRIMRGDKYIVDTYGEWEYFIRSQRENDEDWLTLASNRCPDVAHLLQGIPFKFDWKIIEIGARASAFSGFISNRVQSVVVSDNFQIGQCEGHKWGFEGGDLELWSDRWKKVARRPDRLIAQNIDCRNIAIASDTFECVVCISVIEHILGEGEDVKAIKEMARVLKPGGYLGLTTDFHDPAINTPAEKRYNKEQFLYLVSTSGLKFAGGTYDYDDITPNKNEYGCAILVK